MGFCEAIVDNETTRQQEWGIISVRDSGTEKGIDPAHFGISLSFTQSFVVRVVNSQALEYSPFFPTLLGPG